MPDRPSAKHPSGHTLVEPPGYFAGSFVSAAGLVAGIALAPDGLLLFAAAILLSIIEWRRFREANPWLKLDAPEDFRSPEGKLFMRYSAIGTGLNVALAIGAVVLVQAENRDEAAIGPALIAGVVTIAINYLLKRGAARLGPETPESLEDDRWDDDESGASDHHPDAEAGADADEPAFGGHAPPLEPPAKARRIPIERRRESRKPLPPPGDAPEPEPHETAPHQGDPDDGFVDQDDRALNGVRMDPPHKSKSRRGRADKDDRRY